MIFMYTNPGLVALNREYFYKRRANGNKKERVYSSIRGKYMRFYNTTQKHNSYKNINLDVLIQDDQNGDFVYL